MPKQHGIVCKKDKVIFLISIHLLDFIRMSLFRTLQSSPGTISVFFSKSIPSSSKLKVALEKAAATVNLKRPRFHVDLMESKMPTFDQYNYIVNNCLKDENSKQVLRAAYPVIYGRQSVDETHNRTTIETPIGLQNSGLLGGIKLFSEGEYKMVYDEFNKLEEKHDDETANSIFSPPLVIDWDQSFIGNSQKDLDAMLDKYKKD